MSGFEFYPFSQRSRFDLRTMYAIHLERIRFGMLRKRTMARKHKNKVAIGFKVGKVKLVVVMPYEAILETMYNEDLDERPTGHNPFGSGKHRRRGKMNKWFFSLLTFDS